MREKREVYRKWKQGCVGWEEYRAVVHVCRDRIRKANAQVELNLARDVKDNKKGFYRYIGRRRQAKEGAPPLMKGSGELASSDTEKAEVLNECLASVFMGGQASCVCQDHEPLGEGAGSGFCPTVRVEQVRVVLMKWNVSKSTGPDDIHPRVLKEMADVVAELLFIIFEKPWLSGEVTGTGKRETLLPFLRKGERRIWGTTGQ